MKATPCRPLNNMNTYKRQIEEKSVSTTISYPVAPVAKKNKNKERQKPSAEQDLQESSVPN